jgi:hypothetical protein
VALPFKEVRRCSQPYLFNASLGIVMIIIFTLIFSEPGLVDAGLFPIGAVGLINRENRFLLSPLPGNSVIT